MTAVDNQQNEKPMQLYPAIDIRNGNCVRLYQGDYAQETVYGADPVAQAKAFEAEGASWIHVVDLDAAKSGQPENRATIQAIAAACSARVQTGGGVRDDRSADALWESGVARAIIGTRATEDPDWVARLAKRGPVAVGLDARGMNIAVRGWVEGSGLNLVEFAQRFEDAGVSALIVTEIARDGTLEGPAFDQLGAVLDATSVDVIASGGVGSIEDVVALSAFRRGSRSIAGSIVGRAIYEGAFNVADAIEAIGNASASVGSAVAPDGGA